jgi:transposase
VLEAERAEAGSAVPAKVVTTIPTESFVALPLSAPSSDDTPIRIEVRRGAMTVSVQWPRSALHECALWLRELLQ